MKKEFIIEEFFLLLERRLYKPEFERRIWVIWGKPLTYFEAIIDRSYIYFKNYFNKTKVEASLDYAIACILPKAFLKLEEINTLLKSGFPDGGMSLSRTLHELSTDLLFLINHKESNVLLQSYYDYSDIIYCKELKALKEVYKQIGGKFKRQEELDRLIVSNKALGVKYNNKSFHRDHGWAFCIKGINNFHDMEKETGGNVLRNFYQMGCNAIHSNSRTNRYSLGATDEVDEEILSSGPSIKDLEFPARFALMSLSAIISGVSHYINTDEAAVYNEAYNEIINVILKELTICSKKSKKIRVKDDSK